MVNDELGDKHGMEQFHPWYHHRDRARSGTTAQPGSCHSSDRVVPRLYNRIYQKHMYPHEVGQIAGPDEPENPIKGLRRSVPRTGGTSRQATRRVRRQSRSREEADFARANLEKVYGADPKSAHGPHGLGPGA